MSNKDRYQNAFGKLHLSEDFREKCKTPEESGKGKIMNFRAIHGISRAAAAAVTICTIALGSAGVCYANDIGGIRTTVQMWMNGSRQEVEVIQGNLEGIKVTVQDIDLARGKVMVLVTLLGRETTVELDIEDVRPVE